MSEELEPCLFCGGQNCATLETGPSNWLVECGGCTALGPQADTQEEAIAAWNRRAERWIPVSERLPEEEGHYFVTAHLWNGNTETQITYWTGAEREPSNQFNLHCRAITAWRPLPEPYEEGKNE